MCKLLRNASDCSIEENAMLNPVDRGKKFTKVGEGKRQFGMHERALVLG